MWLILILHCSEPTFHLWKSVYHGLILVIQLHLLALQVWIANISSTRNKLLVSSASCHHLFGFILCINSSFLVMYNLWVLAKEYPLTWLQVWGYLRVFVYHNCIDPPLLFANYPLLRSFSISIFLQYGIRFVINGETSFNHIGQLDLVVI